MSEVQDSALDTSQVTWSEETGYLMRVVDECTLYWHSLSIPARLGADEYMIRIGVLRLGVRKCLSSCSVLPLASHNP